MATECQQHWTTPLDNTASNRRTHSAYAVSDVKINSHTKQRRPT